MRAAALIFPFDLFGSPGTGRGAQLLADALRELLADNRRETRPTRSSAYQGKLRLKEWRFETLAGYDGWRDKARKAIRQAWRNGEFVLWLTGNHLGALPLYDELTGDDSALVVQFDAHLDIYNLADCTEELSHGNFLRHVDGPLPPVVNLGHRDLFLPEASWRPYFQQAYGADELASDPQRAEATVKKLAASARRVLIDLDCDALDPAFFPAVPEPLPFGVAPPALLRWLDLVWSERVVGFSVSEFDPARDDRDRSLALMVWLIEWVLLKWSS